MRTDENGRANILCAMPSKVDVCDMQRYLKNSGVHIYAPAYCAVNADKRFIYLLAEKKMSGNIELKKSTTCENVFTGEVFKGKSIPFSLDEGNCIFLKILED